MDKETLRGDWNMLKGKVKENWGKLTDNDLTEINGKKEQLLGLIQKRYGYAKEKAEQELKDWEKRNESSMKNQESNQENKKYAGAHAGMTQGSMHAGAQGSMQTGAQKGNQQGAQQGTQRGNQPTNQPGNQPKKDWNEKEGKHKH